MDDSKAGSLWTRKEEEELADRLALCLAGFIAESMVLHKRRVGGIKARVRDFLRYGHKSLEDININKLAELKESKIMSTPGKPYEMFTVRSVPPEHETGARGSAARYTTKEQTEEIHLHISTGGASIIYLTKEQAKAFFDLEDKEEKSNLILDPKWKWIAEDSDGAQTMFRGDPPNYDNIEWLYSTGGGYLKSPLPHLDLGKPEESLHQIIDGKLVKYVDIPEDGSPILAHSTEARMISAGKLDNGGWLLCYAGQGNKFTSMGRTVPIRVWRRPTEEELR